MVKRGYFYLKEQNIGIEAPYKLFKRINKNFEEIPSGNVPTAGSIIIEEGKYVEFNRDKSKRYLSTRENVSRDCQGTDFLRYGVLVRTVWKEDSLHYKIQNFLPLDETAALSCFKKVYYSTPSSRGKALVQGSVVVVGGRGILVTGKCWSGKTSLVIGFLEKLKGRFVADGNVLVSYTGGGMRGSYLPRPIFVRFHSINLSECLSKILTNPERAEAVQPFDKEAIEEIIAEKKYELDAGLNFSRKKFAELLGIETLPTCRINTVIHTRFDNADLPIIDLVGLAESHGLLLAREFPKETALANIKHQREIEKPNRSIIEQSWLESTGRIGVSFDAKKNLTRSLLEDLICFH